MSAIDHVKAARSADRATGDEYISRMFTDFTELHGDRRFRDDNAIKTGIGRIMGMPVTVIAIERGKDLSDRMAHNFGMVHPEGYRKALRQLKLAEKFHRPVVAFVDTSGAYPGLGAEERGQGQAIAENLMELMTLKTPVLSILTGEGGSGGALALAVADEVWMMDNAIYSVISPEGCASILWKDSSKVAEAAEALHITSKDLHEFGVIEKIVSEEEGWDALFPKLQKDIFETLQKYQALSPDELIQKRWERFRKF